MPGRTRDLVKVGSCRFGSRSPCKGIFFSRFSGGPEHDLLKGSHGYVWKCFDVQFRCAPPVMSEARTAWVSLGGRFATSALVLVMVPRASAGNTQIPRMRSRCLWVFLAVADAFFVSAVELRAGTRRLRATTASSLETQRHGGTCCGTSTQEVQQSGGCARAAT